jgi:hypothetical protein
VLILFLFRWSPPVSFTLLTVDPLANLSQLVWPALAMGYRAAPKKDSPPALRVGPNPALNRVKSISKNWSAETPVNVGCRPFCFSRRGPGLHSPS